MAGKTQTRSTFAVRLPNLAKATSLRDMGALIETMSAAMATMAGCPAEELKVVKIRMNSPLEVEFQSDRVTAARVQARVDSLAGPIAGGAGDSDDPSRGELAEQLDKLAKNAGGSVELRSGARKWRRFSHRQLNLIARERPRLEPLRSYRTSLTGVLEQVTVEGDRSRFRIRESATGRKIQCDFPQGMLEEVKEALPSRVCVQGTVKCQSDGEAESMEVEHIETLPEASDVPLTELQAMDITGGADAADLIARLRDGE